LQAPGVYGEVKDMKSWKVAGVLSLLLLSLAACTRDPKVQAQRYLENGNKFFAKEKYKEASIMYRRALLKNRLFGEGYYRLGLTDLKLSAYGDAAKMLRNAVDLEPKNSDAKTKLADLYLLASVQDRQHADQLRAEVKDLAAKLLSQDPHSFDGHRLNGQLDMLDKNFAAAEKELEQANQAKPLQPDLVVAYFQALTANDHFPEAEKLAREMIAKDKTYSPIYDLLYRQYAQRGRLNDGEALLKLKVANNPLNPTYLLELANHYYTTNRFSDMDNVIQTMTDEKRFPAGHLLAGDFFFFRLREYDRARQQYDAAIQAFPKDKATYQKRLVELDAATGKSSDANQLLATILKENPKDVDAIAMRAALRLTTGDRAQINMAAADLQALVTKTPDNHLLRFNLARALIAKGDRDAAVLQLQEAVKLRPDFIAARELLARVYLAQGDHGKALKAANDIITIDGNDLQAHLVRSSALLALGDQDKAQQELNLITKAFPNNREARYQVGYLYWQRKDYKKAGEVFGNLHKEDPKDLGGLIGVVETMASEKHMDEAIQTMQEASQAEPKRSDLKLALANLEVRAQKYDDAIQIFSGLLSQQPKAAGLMFRLAETYELKGDLNSAVGELRQCSQVAPSNTACLLQLGQMLERTGHPEQAQPLYEQILKIQPDHPVALNNLAYMKADEGVDLDQALTMAQRALQKLPNSPDVADTLGWIYIKKNLSEDAVRVLQELVTKDPGNPTFHYHFGMALLQKGDKPSARRELETAIKDNPPKDEKAKIQQLLQSL
jgi:tetratricopeptide (TPR) repeat protein